MVVDVGIVLVVVVVVAALSLALQPPSQTTATANAPIGKRRIPILPVNHADASDWRDSPDDGGPGVPVGAANNHRRDKECPAVRYVYQRRQGRRGIWRDDRNGRCHRTSAIMNPVEVVAIEIKGGGLVGCEDDPGPEGLRGSALSHSLGRSRHEVARRVRNLEARPAT